ncbi:hypothetical protein GCM10010245_84740 [Streptomyces spectabilis]|nr:hypothetical protein GCM10010245_84740 [Streptomyces spectabilis]
MRVLSVAIGERIILGVTDQEPHRPLNLNAPVDGPSEAGRGLALVKALFRQVGYLPVGPGTCGRGRRRYPVPWRRSGGWPPPSSCTRT